MNSLLAFGEQKFPEASLLQSSQARGWRGVAAEVRSHPVCDVPAICPDKMEITLAISGTSAGKVERRGNGQFQQTIAHTGTLWLCPIGVEEDSIRITAPIPKVLHLYIPSEQFSQLGELSSQSIAPGDIFYLDGVEDELVRQIGYRVLQELEHETAGGKLLIEQLSLSLLTHLVGRYSTHGAKNLRHDRRHGALDPRRLNRILTYIEDHLDADLTLADLADVACLSRHHFARAFREATGTPPHRFISARRLKHAKALLENSQLTLTEIALASRFSSQASFTRAFQRQTGMSPGRYRKQRIN